jgi:histidinol-phosphate aminotransferase
MTKQSNAISRRSFAQFLGAGAAFAALNPTVSPAMARAERFMRPMVNGNVRLSSNENPYGPSKDAFKAMNDAYKLAWRYPDEHEEPLTEEVARINNVEVKNIILGAGSSEILKLATQAFSGPNKKVVMADPTFESVGSYAGATGAQVAKIKLTDDFRHDLPKMSAVPDAGFIYVCNPNNPTANITPKAEIRSFLTKVGPGTIVMIDEAYHHYVESNDYESVMPLVKQYPNLVVARTFSKIYGMAGLRCGYCVAQPKLIEQMKVHKFFDSLSILTLAAAYASLKDQSQVDNSRRLNSEAKKYVYTELDKMGYRFIPSSANFLMIDIHKPVKPVIQAMRDNKVDVGRVFPALPTHLRVSVGTMAEMEAFVSAFRKVMA